MLLDFYTDLRRVWTYYIKRAIIIQFSASIMASGENVPLHLTLRSDTNIVIMT